MRFLLLDDDPFSLRLLARQLMCLGATDVTCCASAVETLGALDREDGGYAAIFVDLNMPGMDGVEILRHLSGRHFDGGVVLVSGEDRRILQSVADLARARRLRVVAVLHKPVSPLQLTPIIEGLPLHPLPAEAAKPLHCYTASEVLSGIRAQQLVNFYQPQVELGSGRVVSVEALVRWKHPVDGLVSPDRFVPLAEAGGSSGDLARAVLANALRDAHVWRAAGLDLRLSINVSMNDLVTLDIPDDIEHALVGAGLCADHLVLEITETQLTRDRVALLDVATRLRLKGIGLAIDDFGTGYSALASLRDLPFDELKLDRGFISGLGSSDALRAIVQANIAMARQLDIRTVAEGVEDAADWHCLRDLGCDLAQGYLIARPMPVAALVAWVRQWHGTASRAMMANE